MLEKVKKVEMEKNVQMRMEKISNTPGVYQFFDVDKKLLYIGKAVDLKKRVSQYFARPQDERISQMVQKIAEIKTIETDTNIEALILEANLINKYKPPFNVLLKDDKSFGGIFITDENFPLVFSARITDQLPKGEWFGPYVHGKELAQALKVLRRIFKWCDRPQDGNSKKQDTITKQITNSIILHSKLILNSKFENQKFTKEPCFYYHIGLCSGACVSAITRQEYNRQIKHLKMFLCGEKNKLIKTIENDMMKVSKLQNFEQAQGLKNELYGLKHIQESAFVVMGDSPITKSKSNIKIECYDVANIGNDAIVGGMVVLIGDKPDTSQYRQFKIKTIKHQNDVGAIKEMFVRRINHKNWMFPDLTVVDGGLGQVSAVRQILHQRSLVIPVIGITKGKSRNKNELIGDIAFVTSQKISLKILIQARDESHRFARRYYFKRRKKINIDDNDK